MRTLIAVAFIIFAIVGCEVEDKPEPRPTPRPASTPRPTPTPIVTVADIGKAVVSNITSYSGVVDAAVTQDGKTINLVLVVNYAIDPGYAGQIADSFVRMTKTLLKDGVPGEDIGRGEYDYLIGVYYPNEQQLGLGAKSRASSRITW